MNDNKTDSKNNEYENEIKSKKCQKKLDKKNFIKDNILLFFIPIIISIIIYLLINNSKLNKRIEELESRIEIMNKEVVKKKIKIAFITQYLFISGIARFLTVLTELLVKTGKYDVYLITDEKNDIDFNYNKKVKRIILKKDLQVMKDFDEENDIQIYILNNDLSDAIDIYHSFGKKVIGIFHGVYLSCAFSNHMQMYQVWQNFLKLDSFVHIIPDDYWIYKRFQFNNSIFIPNIYTFDSTKTPSSPLKYKNILMVGRFDDVLKGAVYGIQAMAEIVKEVPDAKLTILGLNPPQHLLDLIKQLKIENSVNWPGFSTNITEFYLNTSVLLVTSVSESFPMVMNEGKAHGLPIVAFEIDYCPCFQSGVITVEMFNYKEMAKETIKLLKDYNYRKKKGKESKLSLNNYINNNETIEMWDRLFSSLISDNAEDYKEFQKEVENKFYNESLAKKHLEKQYHYAQQFNEYFKCHSFENFTTLDYINNIEACPV